MVGIAAPIHWYARSQEWYGAANYGSNLLMSFHAFAQDLQKDRELEMSVYSVVNKLVQFQQQQAGNRRMSRCEEHRKAVCGKTTCTV